MDAEFIAPYGAFPRRQCFCIFCNGRSAKESVANLFVPILALLSGQIVLSLHYRYGGEINGRTVAVQHKLNVNTIQTKEIMPQEICPYDLVA